MKAYVAEYPGDGYEKNLYEVLRDFRNDHNERLYDMAERLGIKSWELSKIENGHEKNRKKVKEVLNKIEKAYDLNGIEMATLIFGYLTTYGEGEEGSKRMTKDFTDKDLDKIADESTDYYYEIKKTLPRKRTDPFESSIFGWKNGAPNPKPPRSELPECIKKRIRWVREKCMLSGEITFSECLNLVLPSQYPADEWKLADKYHDYWLPLDNDYRLFIEQVFDDDLGSRYAVTFLNQLEMSVVVALIYGLNDEGD